MKKLLKSIIRFLGFEISRYQKKNILCNKVNGNTKGRSVKSKLLTYFETKSGNYFLPTDAVNDVISIAIKNDEIFDIEVYQCASKHIKEGTVVLDVGSNFGQMSILFSKLVGENGEVHAFEADDFIFDILKKNISANNKIGKIIPHYGAVFNVDNEVLMFPEQDFNRFETYGSYGIDYSSNKTGRQVSSLTIDSLNIQEPISFMKIDIQGGDLQAMQGAIKTIEKNKMPILFEYEYLFEEEYNLSFQDYVDFVQSINYKFSKNINGQNYLIIPNY